METYKFVAYFIQYDSDTDKAEYKGALLREVEAPNYEAAVAYMLAICQQILRECNEDIYFRLCTGE